ncbi:ecotropic viral integration site 5 ortholog-like [Clytia hemisphaerica]|uniref:Nuclear receptor-binding factor 2 MIT domain-containing protein n=1 Tax=Clytia hemisphaerica TaxID=252671 RepID=A0A7M5X622_9CNID|eukprot:TCONS_00063664-protein
MYKSDYFCALSPIDQAHLLERKAEQCLRKEKHEDAIAYHQDAARILQNVLNQYKLNDACPDVLISLQCQINHHRKQDKLIMLRKEQREAMLRRKDLKTSTHQEPFQDLINFSTTSIDSYDSTDLVSTSSHSMHNNMLQEHLAKREEVIKTLGVLVRQQQHQILVLSSKLKEKDDENKRLKQLLEMGQENQNEDLFQT